MVKSAPHAGQALLIILLVMAVALTIGLSVIARSITDIAISKKEEEAAKAFSAAEAGIEQALIATCSSFPCNPAVPTVSTGEITSLLVDTLVASGGKSFVHPQLLAAGESASIWLVSHNADKELECSSTYPCFTSTFGNLGVCWGKKGTASDSSTTPAIEIMVFYTSGSGSWSTTKVARTTLDANATRRGANGFGYAIGGGGCAIPGASQTFEFTTGINLFSPLGVTLRSSSTNSTGPQLIRVRLLYNTDQTHPVGINVDYLGNGPLPQQGIKILSTGTSGNATRKLEVYKLYSDLPSIFDYAVFSGTGGIVK